MDQVPDFPGEYAKPTRGDQSFLVDFGESKLMTPGTSAIALYCCAREPTGTPTYSYLIPRLRVRFERTR
jgi:hypothetical protein